MSARTAKDCILVEKRGSSAVLEVCRQEITPETRRIKKGAIVEESEGRGIGFVMLDEQNCNSSMEIGEKEIEDDSGHALANGGEKKRVVWWKLPFELLTFCALKVKPLWSISMAAAVVGVWMLKKRLYRKQKTQIVPLRIILHEKKALRLKIHAKRLDEAYNIARRVIVVRSSPSAGSLIAQSMADIR